MNEELILKMIQPYIKNNSITYEEFDNLFEMLSRKEQYQALDIIAANKIELRPDDEEDYIDYEPTSEDLLEIEKEFETELENEFDILYEDSIFADKESDVEKKDNNILEVKSKVYQSNETLCRLIQEGSMQAKQDLCIKNNGLVKKVASWYEKSGGNDLSYEDLEQIGMVGMLKAAERFDYRRGYTFSTYAMWWIKQSISREIYDTGYTIRVPVHMMERIKKVNKIYKTMSLDGLTNKQIIEEIADELELSPEMVDNCICVQELLLKNPSLDKPVGEDGDLYLVDLVQDNTFMAPDEEAEFKILKMHIEEVLSTLTEREQKVIRLRFGLDDGRARTLEEVGKEFNVTRERIRQIAAKALRKLRHPSRSRKLKDFLY